MTIFTFDKHSNYHEQFEEYVSSIVDTDDYYAEDVATRITLVTHLFDSYYEEVEENPPSRTLGRLSTYILSTDLKDKTPTKDKGREYPILSRSQIDRRMKRYVSLALSTSYDTEGKNQSIETRLNRQNERELLREYKWRVFDKEAGYPPIKKYNIHTENQEPDGD